ncbi:unnamed protein product [Mytilus edulis]|uniref:Apextrin C-terminal domain-containing protein n=1 Tax=Mytilus edulis TaxID=6550 RepID=A0A8S3TN58_MYTED|nr:unnamed protein product [Mytilus edulis]
MTVREESVKMDDEDDRNNSDDGGCHPTLSIRTMRITPMLTQKVMFFHMEFMTETQQLTIAAVSWPYGRFSIPKPKTGCPSGWSEGWRYQDNEDDIIINIVIFSESHHFYGTFGEDTEMYYCTKQSPAVQDPGHVEIIVLQDMMVPARFCTGFIYWDDEDNANANQKSGVLPDGVYNRNTKINYCCRSDGSSYSYINLPTSKPFICTNTPRHASVYVE